MKYLFAIILLILLGATALNHLSRPEVRSGKPILYWVTSTNEARQQQVKQFHQWIEENGYPPMELRIDSSNRDISKKLIQGVSGVGADIIDMVRDEPWLLESTGMLEDLTELAAQHGFGPDKTWKAKYPSVIINGAQYSFPRGTSVQMYFVNVGLLEEHGMAPPLKIWDHATFEKMGKEFVRRANPPGERQTIFFADMVNRQVMRRSMGLALFNETLTRCILDDPRSVETYRLIYKWMFEDRILPSQADLDFFAGSDTVTSRIQLFARGRYALTTNGRYALIQLREYKHLRLTLREPPNSHFRNTLFGSAGTAIYAGSDKKELAAYLLKFFTSERYNMQIVYDADSLPPVPRYTEIEAYRRPPDYPNEWEIHEPYAEAARSIAISAIVSPFILPYAVNRFAKDAWQSLISGSMNPQEAAQDVTDRINRQMARNISEDPKLKKEFDRLQQLQGEIDRLRREGKPVPLEWIGNSFYKKYYVFRGWSEESPSQDKLTQTK